LVFLQRFGVFDKTLFNTKIQFKISISRQSNNLFEMCFQEVGKIPFQTESIHLQL
jgi:hypothetical protein